jgi:hypothetical protein
MVIMLAWDAAKTNASYELVKEHPNSICIQKVLMNEVLVERARTTLSFRVVPLRFLRLSMLS